MGQGYSCPEQKRGDTVAERRMFAKTIIDSDAFLDMPLSTQALYFHLSMRADDDGFINNPKKIQRVIGCSDDDLKLLAAKRFVIPFETGVCVIKHWLIHNYIRPDRYKETAYKDEKSRLFTKENKAYTLEPPDDFPALPDIGIPNGSQAVDNRDTQGRIGKVRVGKGSLESMGAVCDAAAPAQEQPAKPERHKFGRYGWVKLSDDEYSRLLNDLGAAELERCIAYVDESAQSNGNKNKWRDWNLVVRKCARDGWGKARAGNALPGAAGGRNAPPSGVDRLLEMMDRGEFDD